MLASEGILLTKAIWPRQWLVALPHNTIFSGFSHRRFLSRQCSREIGGHIISEATIKIVMQFDFRK